MPKRNTPGCRCCGCYASICVINIYDESQPNYVGFAPWWDYDNTQWSEFIEPLEHSVVRVGIIHPNTPVSQVVKDGAENTPSDTVGVMLTQRLDHDRQGARVRRQDIVDFFDALRVHPETGEGVFGDIPPEPEEGEDAEPDRNVPRLLVFCLDDSGSILISNYAFELGEAKRMLKERHPGMAILQDVSSADERWLRDSLTAVQDRLCPEMQTCGRCKIPHQIKANLTGTANNLTSRGCFYCESLWADVRLLFRPEDSSETDPDPEVEGDEKSVCVWRRTFHTFDDPSREACRNAYLTARLYQGYEFDVDGTSYGSRWELEVSDDGGTQAVYGYHFNELAEDDDDEPDEGHTEEDDDDLSGCEGTIVLEREEQPGNPRTCNYPATATINLDGV